MAIAVEENTLPCPGPGVIIIYLLLLLCSVIVRPGAVIAVAVADKCFPALA